MTSYKMKWLHYILKRFRSSKQYLIKQYSMRRRRVNTRLFHFPTSVAVFGAPGAGKTLITRRFSGKDFPDNFQKVTEIYKITLTTRSSDGIMCKHDLSVHDTPGNLRGTFPDLYESVIRKSDAFLLVFSMNDPISLKVTKRTLADLMNLKGKQAPIMIVANKSDLASRDEDVIQERYRFYREVTDMEHSIVEVSAKQAENFTQNWLPLLVELERRQGVRECDLADVYLADGKTPPQRFKRRHTVR